MAKNLSFFDETYIDTVLAGDIRFKGTLKFTSSLMIKGNFDGNIDAKEGHLIIGPNAFVKAQIKSKHLSCKGSIEGNIEAIESVELFDSSKITGNVQSPVLYMEKGAILNGQCVMGKQSS